MTIAFLVNYSTEYDTCLGGSAIVYAEDREEAYLKSEDYCQSKIFEEIDEEDVGLGEDIVVDITVSEYNNLVDGDIRDYEVIEQHKKF